MSAPPPAVLALASQIENRLGLRDAELVRHLALTSQTVDQARQYAGLPDADGRRERWREMFSEESQRLYYADKDSSQTSWDPPPAFRFADWQLDCSTYSIDILIAKRIFEAAHYLQAENGGGSWRQPVRLLIKALANVVDCGNSESKFRHLPLSNDRVRANFWDVIAARQLLEAVGYQARDNALVLADDAPLGPLAAALARLRRLADNKGHSGEAEFFPLPNRGGGGAAKALSSSSLLGMQGYRHQEHIYHCSACDYGINDGSERLFTGLHTAPKGEYRYQCTSCTEAFNLCERCWDKLQGGALSHDPSHNWQHHHPRTQRHNTQSGADTPGASPWGMPAGAGASAGRALARLHERYGIHSPG